MADTRNQLSYIICWIGSLDLKYANERAINGPIVTTLRTLEPAPIQVVLLSNFSVDENNIFIEWLRQTISAEIVLAWSQPGMSPVNYQAIHDAEKAVLVRYAHLGNHTAILLSPGTPQMQSVWLLLAKTYFPDMVLLSSSIQKGVEQVDLPFRIAAEFTPLSDAKLQDLASPATLSTAFDDILSCSEVMLTLKQKAVQLARRNLPVLLLGETGTGKELFATAIHHGSSRVRHPMIPINCGAIPLELVDAELFGYEKGAFTGATQRKLGIFEAANGGTVFLDEIGELPLIAQVRLLRVLQEKRIRRVGGSEEIDIDVRIIAATHRDLSQHVADGRFREDLFYRLSIGVLTLPPLRERTGDILFLSERLLQAIAEAESLPLKRLSSEAARLVLNHAWPGNVRELQNTLLRATLWQRGVLLTADDLQQAFLKRPAKPQQTDSTLWHTLGETFQLEELLSNVERHYLHRAMEQSAGVKKVASDLLGYRDTNQTLNKRLTKHGLI
jgi:transcriptional regulator with PAS, ATPase and Fis domain